MRFDTLVPGGTIAAAADTFRADICIRNYRIAAHRRAISAVPTR